MSWLGDLGGSLANWFTGSTASNSNSNIMSAVNNGASADTVASMGKMYTDRGDYDTFSSLGNMLGGLGDSTSSLAGYIKPAASMYDMYSQYNTNKTLEDYYKTQTAIAQQNAANSNTLFNKQLEDQATAQAAMTDGYAASGLAGLDPTKDRQYVSYTMPS